MTDHNREGELRPCPFCGKQQVVEHWAGDGDLVDPPCIGDYFTLEEWQNAYCWKELDKLRAEKEAYREVAIIHSWSDSEAREMLKGFSGIPVIKKKVGEQVDIEAQKILAGKKGE